MHVRRNNKYTIRRMSGEGVKKQENYEIMLNVHCNGTDVTVSDKRLKCLITPRALVFLLRVSLAFWRT